MKKERFIVPGERVGVIEEYIPGKGTYVKDGVIRSAITGSVTLVGRIASIYQAVQGPTLPRVGSTVFGQVVSCSASTCTIKIIITGRSRLARPFTGILHISSVSSKFLHNVAEAFKVGDIVRAKVVSLKNNVIHLSTVGRMLGVILAFCSQCGKPLRRGKALQCPACGNVEKRKIALDYGRVA